MRKRSTKGAGASPSGRPARDLESGGRKPPGQRQLRVAERIRHILVDVLRRGDLNDPALTQSELITVTGVDIGPDLKHAVAFVMPLGGKNVETIVAALNRATGYFRTEVGHELELRHAPKISFKIDHSFEQAEHIERLLRQTPVLRDTEKENEED